MTSAFDRDGVAIVPRRPDHPDAVALLGMFYREQVGRYGFAESVDLDPSLYEEPNGVFVVIYRDERPVGCGACRWYDRATGTAEVKKTYLVASERGRGVGRLLLAWLETAAAGWGCKRVILETGVRNTAALSLFGNFGYRSMPRYVEGRDASINRAFEKSLPGEPQSNRTDDGTNVSATAL